MSNHTTTNHDTVLLLYPTAAAEPAGQPLKNTLQAQGLAVEELVMMENYDQVLDALEESVIPVVIG